jgi:hypothetical protein
MSAKNIVASLKTAFSLFNQDADASEMSDAPNGLTVMAKRLTSCTAMLMEDSDSMYDTEICASNVFPLRKSGLL